MRITYSKGIATVTFDSHDDQTSLWLYDLPDNVLVEILCRLPCKFVAQCKCVCKSWSTLISHPYFQTRRALYLRNNCDHNEQIPMFVKISPRGHHVREFMTISKQTDRPVLISLNFLPRSLTLPFDRDEMVVVATYNDLILLCGSSAYPTKYYICNIYTKQWVALPPTNRVLLTFDVGFICDSDNKCRIVRLLEIDPFRLKVEVFSSDTCKWTVSVVTCPQRFSPVDIKQSRPALADDGMLYWLGTGGFLIGLDPFKLEYSNHHCCFVSKPLVNYREVYTECLGMCRGSVRLCRMYDLIEYVKVIYVWELKEEEEDDDDSEVDGVGGKMMKWCLKKDVALGLTTDLQHWSTSTKLLALDPNDEDLIYVQCTRRRNSSWEASIVVCNIRTLEVIDIPRKFPCSDSQIEAFPFVLPCWQWPTPVPRLDSSCQTN